MSIKPIRNIFALALILFTAIGCGRYEDGPCISFRSAENRIIGKWKVEYFEVDGVDITQQWIDNYDWEFEFYVDEPSITNRVLITGIRFYSDSNVVSYANSFWKLSNNEKTLSFDISNFTFPPSDTLFIGIYPLQTYSSATYIIRKLTKHEIWLSSENAGHIYFIELN